jgi:prepilin-type processing-associated H-X9-DG protein
MLANYQDNCSDCVNKSPTGRRNNYRWGEPDVGNGVSGPHQDSVNKTARINNNSTPKGGPSSCPWSQNNCGPNDEPFSTHSGGVNAVWGDGHVAFLRDSITPQVLRGIMTADGGEVVSLD